MSISIFNKRLRTEKDRGKYNESDFEFYDRIDNESYNEFRNKVECWYSFYPEEHKSKFDWKNAFKQSFFELLIFKFFKNLGYEILVDVPLEGSNKTPDFLCTKADEIFYVEATIVKDKSFEKEKLDNLKSSIYAEIEKVKTKDYIYGITKFEIKKRIGLNPRSLKKRLKKFIDENDVSEVENTSFSNRPIFNFEDDSMVINIEIIPKKEEFRDEFTEKIGLFEGEAKFMSQGTSIARAISKKIKKYKNSTIPILICVNYTDGIHLYENEIAGRIYGKKNKYDINLGSYRNVIGIVITSIFPSNLHAASSTLFLNPNRSSNLTELINVFRIFQSEDKSKNEENKQVLGKVLQINENWFYNTWGEEEHNL